MPETRTGTSVQLAVSVLDLVPRLPGYSDEEALRQAVSLAQHAEKMGLHPVLDG